MAAPPAPTLQAPPAQLGIGPQTPPRTQPPPGPLWIPDRLPCWRTLDAQAGPAEAAVCFQEAAAAARTSADKALQLSWAGTALELADRWEEAALLHLDAAVAEGGPAAWSHLDAAAWCRERAGNAEQAQDLLERALALAPAGTPRAWVCDALVGLWQRTGRAAEELARLDARLAESPTDLVALELAARLVPDRAAALLAADLDHAWALDSLRVGLDPARLGGPRLALLQRVLHECLDPTQVYRAVQALAPVWHQRAGAWEEDLVRFEAVVAAVPTASEARRRWADATAFMARDWDQTRSLSVWLVDHPPFRANDLQRHLDGLVQDGDEAAIRVLLDRWILEAGDEAATWRQLVARALVDLWRRTGCFTERLAVLHTAAGQGGLEDQARLVEVLGVDNDPPREVYVPLRRLVGARGQDARTTFFLALLEETSGRPEVAAAPWVARLDGLARDWDRSPSERYRAIEALTALWQRTGRLAEEHARLLERLSRDPADRQALAMLGWAAGKGVGVWGNPDLPVQERLSLILPVLERLALQEPTSQPVHQWLVGWLWEGKQYPALVLWQRDMVRRFPGYTRVYAKGLSDAYEELGLPEDSLRWARRVVAETPLAVELSPAAVAAKAARLGMAAPPDQR